MLHSKFKGKLREYGVGPLLYMPALRTDIPEKLLSLKKEGLVSAAICLEDTIRDDMVPFAEKHLTETLMSLYDGVSRGSISADDLPEIFIRVRRPVQIGKLTSMCGESIDLCGGFILPKIDDTNIIRYIDEIERLDRFNKKLYIMPIIENPSVLIPYKRAERLHRLYKILSERRKLVLNIRVGGNDFCSCSGIRTDVHHTIYDAAPVASVLADISAAFSSEFTVSAPVWNYFDGEGWDIGMKREMDKDRYYGFIGKTIIHPKQIPLALADMKVSAEDYEAARLIINNESEIQVIKSGGRMYENKVHSIWAEKILGLAEVYGISGKETV